MYRFKFLILCAVVIVAHGAFISSPVDDFKTVKIEGGRISGTRNGDVHIFKGIPFAAPPVGELRWKAPAPVAPWSGVKACTNFSASPIQGKPTPFMVYTPEFLIPEEPISEDCLYLNVWTGAKSQSEKRPVLVWIYGGGFSSGGSACPIYDGEALARKGVVFVSLNYRVGVMGFLAHPELSKENSNKTSGNYGLLDQIAALKWVQKNIAAFGGDASNVTIAGQSAGAMSVNCLVASPLAKGLFTKAIAESGSTMLSKGFVRTADLRLKESEGKQLAGSATLADLRKLSAEEVQQQIKGRFSPVIDGYVLPQPIPEIFAKGNDNDVTLLTGWNQDERFGQLTSMAEYKRQLESKYAADAPRILTYYPAGSESEAMESQKALGRDETFGISNYAWAKIQSQKKRKVYLYNFLRKPPAEGEYIQYGAFHTAEVPYAFNTLKHFKRPLQPSDYALADLMSSYWTNFAKTGDPNGSGLPLWSAFDDDKAMVMMFDEESSAKPFPRKDAMDTLFEILK
ncbi:MAG TPA: carboxylesterase family protein [Chryseosolibacter sp.]